MTPSAVNQGSLRRRTFTACSNARVTSSALLLVATRKPRMRLEKPSCRNDTYTVPSRAARCVKSATQTRSGASCDQSRFTRSANERRLDRGRSCAPGGAGRSPNSRPGASVERPGPAWRGDEVGHGHAFGAGMGSGCGRGCNQDGATHVSAYLRCRVSTKRGGGAYWWIDATCGRDGAGRGACVLDHLDVAAQLHCAFLARCVRALTCRAHAGETLFSPGVRSSSTCTVVSFDPWCLMATKRS